LLEAFAVLIGLILEKEHIVEAVKFAEVFEASERLPRTLLGTVSKELRAPLFAAQTRIDALSKEISDDPKKQSMLGEIRGALERLQRVVSNLVEMTRIESQMIESMLDWCDVRELIDKAIASTGEAIAAHRLVIEMDENLPMVKLDQALIQQCLVHLLTNAAEWSKPGSTITVRAELKDSTLGLSVLDEGPGVSEADIDHVFEKFYRAPDSQPGGTGLGLSIVQGFVRLHGGNVRAARRPTGGSEFTLTIPVETTQSKALGA
jgi:two-component system sensor histidine kinase KdpD